MSKEGMKLKKARENTIENYRGQEEEGEKIRSET